MRWRNAFLSFVAVLGAATIARAADPEIFAGYGRTRWGQTIEEVRAIYPQLQEVARYRELKKVPLDSSPDEDASDYPLDRFFATPVPEPLQEMVFGFADGRLYVVEFGFSPQARETLDNLALARMVWDKYFSSEKARAQLAERSFRIHVVSHKGGLFITDQPKQPEQLLQPGMYQYGNFDLGMHYEDNATESRVRSRGFPQAGGRRSKAARGEGSRHPGFAVRDTRRDAAAPPSLPCRSPNPLRPPACN